MKVDARRSGPAAERAQEEEKQIHQDAPALQPDPLHALQAGGPQGVLRLQRAAGNRQVARWLQAKLMVGPAGDQYEQEADRVAEQVLAAPASSSGAVQRAAEEEEEIQTSRVASTITPLQRAAEEEEELQMKPLQRAAEEEEELQMKPLQRAAEEEEELQMKPLQRAAEEEEELQMKPLQHQG
jgi:hypothetical protein